MVNRSHITDTKMDEDEYVETSDVEELDDAYALRGWHDFDDETLRKRRKVIYILFAEFSTDIWSA